jgi:hypothetical protein
MPSYLESEPSSTKTARMIHLGVLDWSSEKGLRVVEEPMEERVVKETRRETSGPMEELYDVVESSGCTEIAQ